jgi:hypothetical protein
MAINNYSWNSYRDKKLTRTGREKNIHRQNSKLPKEEDKIRLGRFASDIRYSGSNLDVPDAHYWIPCDEHHRGEAHNEWLREDVKIAPSYLPYGTVNLAHHPGIACDDLHPAKSTIESHTKWLRSKEFKSFWDEMDEYDRQQLFISHHRGEFCENVHGSGLLHCGLDNIPFSTEAWEKGLDNSKLLIYADGDERPLAYKDPRPICPHIPQHRTFTSEITHLSWMKTKPKYDHPPKYYLPRGRARWALGIDGSIDFWGQRWSENSTYMEMYLHTLDLINELFFANLHPKRWR